MAQVKKTKSLSKRKAQHVPSVANNDSPPAASASGPSLRTRLPQIILLGLLTLLPPLFQLFVLNPHQNFEKANLISAFMAPVGYLSTVFFIPVGAVRLLKRNIFGYDLNKKGSPAGRIRIPESVGLVSAAVFWLMMSILGCFFPTTNPALVMQYDAALSSISLMIALGFMDDVLDVPWRIKLLVPAIAAFSLVWRYNGGTDILIPKPVQGYIGMEILDLGWMYKLYLGLLIVFFANAINIHAGINGLEVVQSIIICGAVLVLNLMQISSGTYEHQEAHAFSLYFMQPFLGVSLGLLAYNLYPSSVFVGDTFTYFAGMSLVVVGIFGHFSEMLLLFSLPQILNFLYSLPQLLNIVPCPRHRLPVLNAKKNLLVGTKDMNLLNLILRLFGPCSERNLLIRLSIFQVLSVGLSFVIRYYITGWYK